MCSAEPPRRGQRDHRRPFAQRCHAVVEVVYLAFGKDDQRSISLRKHIDGGAKRPQVGPLAVNAERPESLERPPLQAEPALENLPRREITTRQAEAIHRLEDDERVAVGRMIDRNHRRTTFGQRPAHMLLSAQLHVSHQVHAPIHAAAQRSQRPLPEPARSGRPKTIVRLEQAPFHWGSRPDAPQRAKQRSATL